MCYLFTCSSGPTGLTTGLGSMGGGLRTSTGLNQYGGTGGMCIPVVKTDNRVWSLDYFKPLQPKGGGGTFL